MFYTNTNDVLGFFLIFSDYNILFFKISFVINFITFKIYNLFYHISFFLIVDVFL